jgi:cytochrome c peroxidase
VPPPTSGVNRPPVLQQTPADPRGVTGHPLFFDFSTGGTAVTDADGDVLTWTITPAIGRPPPPGLTVSGAILSGVPTQVGFWDYDARVDDRRSGTTTVHFRLTLRVTANAAPVLSVPGTPVIVAVGEQFTHDATRAGAAFQDPDGDPVRYEVSLLGSTAGIGVTGSQVFGTFPAVGAVQVTLTARDDYGGVSSNAFLIAAPAVATAAPVLPATSFVYRDEELPLPAVFRMSSESRIPLWDTQPADNRTTNAGATLGRVLFHDNRLSITNTISCGSCHEQKHGFGTDRRFDTGVLGLPLTRNSMALANVRYSIHGAWFWDMRQQETLAVRGLQVIVMHPLEEHRELGMTPALLIEKLSAAGFYGPLFRDAFGSEQITAERIRAALAQYVQSLISYRTRHDLAYNPMENVPRNPEAVLNAQELRGLAVFLNHCGICHRPEAGTNEWQANNGLDLVPVDVGTTNPAFQRDGSIGVFRAPALRNIARSAPYMHDGRFSSLREVIEHYNSGVVDSRDVDGILRHPLNGPRRLNLSEADKQAIEIFLNLLTDDAMLNDPKFSDPFAVH